MSKDDRAVVITGSNSGIGEAIARTLAKDGMSVLLVARNEASLAEVAGSINAAGGGRAAWLSTDLAAPDCGPVVTEAALAAFGKIDVLVNSASQTVNKPFFEVSDEEWIGGLAVKVLGPLRLVRAMWPHLTAAKGAIVNIGGVGARTPRQARGTTSVMSGAMMAETKIFADLGLKGGVRVNMVNPGTVITPRSIESWTRQAEAENITLDEVIAKRTRDFSTVRMGTAQDTANLVRYILSEEGSLLHGSIIDLDGGTTKSL